MKKNRVACFALMFLSLIFGLYTGEKIFFMLFTVLLILVVFSLIMIIWILIDFKYLQTIEPEIVEKGQSTTIKIEIHNDRPFIYPYMKVNFKTMKEAIKGSEKERVISILPFKHETIEETFLCNLRGKYPIGITTLEVQDPFGLFTFTIDLSKKHYYKQLYLTVYPRILEIPSLPLHSIEREKVQSSQLIQTEEPSSVSGIRQYEYGDPLKKIHWKISSKYQDIYVKEYEASSGPKALIFLETTPCPIDKIARHELEDQMIECTISIVNHMLYRKIYTELVIYNENRQQLRGNKPHDISYFFDYLSLLSFDSNLPLNQILTLEETTIGNSYNIILITHNMDYNLFNRICILKQLDFYPIVFLIVHNMYLDRDVKNMVVQLNDMDIPSYMISTAERLDEVLEDLT